jgi:hypothetical protein
VPADIMSQALPLASLLDLPTEILLLILEDVCDQDLFSLSLISRRLNILALKLVLANIVPYDSSTQSCGEIVLRTPMQETLLIALRRSIFISSIRRLEFRVPGNGDKHPRWSMGELELLVSNTSLDRIQEFKLNLGRRLKIRVPPVHPVKWLQKTSEMSQYPNSFWTEIFAGITKAISQRSCESVTIEGGQMEYWFPETLQFLDTRTPDNDGDIKWLSFLWCQSQGVRGRSGDWRRQLCYISITALRLPWARFDTLPFDFYPLTNLKALHIRTSLITSFPFFFWVISSINLSPITTLSFSGLSISSLAWRKLLLCLTIPTLSSLSIASTNIFTADIFSFLSRHPRIRDLNLHQRRIRIEDLFHRTVGPSSPSSLSYSVLLSRYESSIAFESVVLSYPLSPPPRQKSVFSSLVTLSATPEHIAYLLETKSRGGQPIFPNLAKISIAWHDAAHLGAMDCALDAISKLGLRDIHLVLSVVASISKFQRWIDNIVYAVDDTVTRTYWDSLHCVKSLQIPAYQGDHLILCWLSKFPAIEKVTFDDWFKETSAPEKDKLKAKIFASCPCMKEVCI